MKVCGDPSYFEDFLWHLPEAKKLLNCCPSLRFFAGCFFRFLGLKPILDIKLFFETFSRMRGKLTIGAFIVLYIHHRTEICKSSAYLTNINQFYS
jgi:hypothetical protein